MQFKLIVKPYFVLSHYLCLSLMKNFLALLFLMVLISSCGVKPPSYATSRFTEEQKNLILSGSEKTPMRVYKINNKQDSLLLRTNSDYVSIKKDKELLGVLIERMKTTMTDSMSLGVGIAAPQVGILKRVIIVQRFDKKSFPTEGYINPVIVQYSKKTQPCKEGCLSIPGRSDMLNTRAYAILLEYDTLNGEHQTEMIEDFTAVIFQHEIDHLNGILYIDHLQQEITDTKH